MNFTKTNDGFSMSDSDSTIRLLGARVRRFNWSRDEARGYYSPITMSDFKGIVSNKPTIEKSKLQGTSKSRRTR